MLKNAFFISLYVLVHVSIRAQTQHRFDLTIGSNLNQSTLAVGWQKQITLPRYNKLKVGYGLRLTSHIGKNSYFISAPKKFYNNPPTFDSIQVNNYIIASINLSLHIAYAIHPKIQPFFSIDALGMSVGDKQQSTYQNRTVAVSPTAYNVLLVDKNDIGTLYSLFGVTYKYHTNWGIQIGVAHVFNELKSDVTLFENNDRYRNISNQFVLGVFYSP